MARYFSAHCLQLLLLLNIPKVYALWPKFLTDNIPNLNVYLADLIKDSARPSYWVPDSESPKCVVCEQPFGTAEELTAAASPSHRRAIGNRTRHHCRACGLAVCNPCSLGRRPVPERGWTTDVRICDHCNKKSKCE